MGEWPHKRIKDVALRIGMGPFGSSIKVDTFVAAGVPVISGEHLRNTRLEEQRFNFVTIQHADKLKNSNVFKGDVIFTHAGSIGQCAFIPANSQYSRYILSQRQFYLRCDTNQVLPEFVTYFFKSHQGQHLLLANASQTGVPSIARPSSYLKTIQIPVPPLAEQREIANILGALDDKIELNRRMNATLEAMARALFQSWFVDFDPVRAKAEGRQPVGMDAETAALFPDSFEDSVLGPIPKGWKLGNIDDLTNLHRQTVDPGSKPTQLFAHYSLPAFDDGLRAEKVLGEQIKSNKYIVPNRAILVSKLNPHIPRVWLVSVGDNVPAICSTEFIVCTPTESSTAAFLYMLFTSEAFTTRYRGLVSGTTGSHQRVRPEDFRSMNVAIPNQSLVAAFTVFGGVLLSQSATLAHTNEVLRAARDTLLPKLLSGELRVGNVAA